MSVEKVSVHICHSTPAFTYHKTEQLYCNIHSGHTIAPPLIKEAGPGMAPASVCPWRQMLVLIVELITS